MQACPAAETRPQTREVQARAFAGRSVEPDAAARFTGILDGLARLHRSVVEHGREEEQ